MGSSKNIIGVFRRIDSADQGFPNASMSHDGFHVHGPDQHELEHQAAHGDNLAVRVSIMTAILATFGAVFSYLGSSQQTAAADLKNDALLAKNEAIQLRTQAANQWSFYQSKSTKQNLSELAQALTQDEALKAKYAGKSPVTSRRRRTSRWSPRASRNRPMVSMPRSARCSARAPSSCTRTTCWPRRSR